MKYLIFEIQKLIRSRWSRILAIITALLYPSLLIATSYLTRAEASTAEGNFISYLAFATLAYAQIYILIPVWILIGTGREFDTGYVQRYILIRARQDYFKSKIAYCIIVASAFSLLGVLTFPIAVYTSAFDSRAVDAGMLTMLFLQMMMAHIIMSLALLGLVFLIRTTIKAFVIYIAWTWIEGTVSLLLDRLTSIPTAWMPLHVIRSIYTHHGSGDIKDYYNPVADGPYLALLGPFLLVLVLTVLSYRRFRTTGLPALTD